MTVSVDEALEQLNTDAGSVDAGELQLYVDAANEWVDGRIGQPGWMSVADAAVRPNVVKLATLFLVDHLWESQRGPAASPLSGAEEGGTLVLSGFAIPNRVRELLQDNTTARVGSGGPSFSFPDAVGWPDPVEWPAP